MVCEERGAHLVVVPVDERGEVDPDEFSRRLGPRTKLAAFAHVSNALGTVLPVADLVRRAHAAGVPVFVDGAQSAPHCAVDVGALGCDFFAFSGHKVYGPTGIGALYGRQELLAAMPPWQGGGGMIRSVTFERTTYDDPPRRFEAGTPAAAEAIGLAAALDYVDGVRLAGDRAPRSRAWSRRRSRASSRSRGLRLIGRPRERAGVVSFVLDGIHAHDLGTVLDHYGVAVRAGHHCAQPLMRRFGVPATVRASFALYNTRDEVAALAARRSRERRRSLARPAAASGGRGRRQMNELQTLYQEVLLDHYRSPRNRAIWPPRRDAPRVTIRCAAIASPSRSKSTASGCRGWPSRAPVAPSPPPPPRS